MQDLVADALSSKRIPLAIRIAALPHRIAAELARPLRTGQKSAAATAHPGPKPAGGLVAATATLTRTYSGTMKLGGTFSDTANQSGTWSGMLHERLIVTVDANGNGMGYESFTGSLSATVKDPDGSTRSIAPEPFNFYLPVFTITAGHFSVSQDSGVLGGIQATLKVDGTLSTSQPITTENLSIPFSGFVQDVLFSGSVTGNSSLSTRPLAMGGTVKGQSAYAGTRMNPFQNLILSDLNGVPVTATVTLSKTGNGTLTNLGGGKYNRITGTYTITGSASTVNQALNALQFDPNGKLVRAATAFTIKITDSKGVSLINKSTSVLAINPLSIESAFPHQGVKTGKTIAPFTRITIGDRLNSDSDVVKIVLSSPADGTLTNLGGGKYNKKTGTYIIKGSAYTTTAALHGLIFNPSGPVGTRTGFTITVVNSTGAMVSRNNVTVTEKGTTPSTALPLFSQYVAAGLGGTDHAAGMTGFRDLPSTTHLQLASSHR